LLRSEASWETFERSKQQTPDGEANRVCCAAKRVNATILCRMFLRCVAVEDEARHGKCLFGIRSMERPEHGFVFWV